MDRRRVREAHLATAAVGHYYLVAYDADAGHAKTSLPATAVRPIAVLTHIGGQRVRALAAVSWGAVRMTRFFFHAHGSISVFDDVGLELQDIAAAQAAAIELNSRILNEGAEGPFWQDLSWRVEVTDDPGICGQTFLVVQFSVTTALLRHPRH